MPRKCIVKVILSKEQKEMLQELARRLGTSESETMRMALMDYVKSLSLMEERVKRQAHSFSKFDSNSVKSIT
ncbi:MAG: ribbon-helix-helix protein, CopG family [Candidatus Bathyarchaeia archaeon]